MVQYESIEQVMEEGDGRRAPKEVAVPFRRRTSTVVAVVVTLVACLGLTHSAGLWELTCPCNGCCHATRYINWSSRSLSLSFGRTGRTHGESESNERVAPVDSTEALPAESSQTVTCEDGGCATFSPADSLDLPADAPIEDGGDDET